MRHEKTLREPANDPLAAHLSINTYSGVSTVPWRSCTPAWRQVVLNNFFQPTNFIAIATRNVQSSHVFVTNLVSLLHD